MEHGLCDKTNSIKIHLRVQERYKPEVVPSRSPVPSWACLQNFSSLHPENFAIYCFVFSRRTYWKSRVDFKVKNNHQSSMYLLNIFLIIVLFCSSYHKVSEGPGIHCIPMLTTGFLIFYKFTGTFLNDYKAHKWENQTSY